MIHNNTTIHLPDDNLNVRVGFTHSAGQTRVHLEVSNGLTAGVTFYGDKADIADFLRRLADKLAIATEAGTVTAQVGSDFSEFAEVAV
jgi:hypothetical protein